MVLPYDLSSRRLVGLLYMVVSGQPSKRVRMEAWKLSSRLWNSGILTYGADGSQTSPELRCEGKAEDSTRLRGGEEHSGEGFASGSSEPWRSHVLERLGPAQRLHQFLCAEPPWPYPWVD